MKVKNTIIYKIIKKILYLCIIYPKEIFFEVCRKYNIDNRYNYLKKYKNIHEGERCFIVATGPSLTVDDYLKLRNEHTIGVNALCLWFKRYKMETEYFVVSDDDVFRRVKNNLAEVECTQIFVSERIKKTNNVSSKYNVFPVNIWNRFVIKKNKKKFSNDFSVCSYDDETVIFHAIQLAIYMGFREIYLLGTDCNYNQSKAYAINHGKKVDKKLGEKMISSYFTVKEYENIYRFKIYNATRGGMLEVFERKNLDEVLEVNL